MTINLQTLTLATAIAVTAQMATAGQFIVELGAPLQSSAADMLTAHAVAVDERLSGADKSYAVFTAPDEVALAGFLQDATVGVDKISEVLFINSPAVGGGPPSNADPRPDLQLYVIERPIPGVGFFGIEKKQAVARNSNEVIEKLGDVIKWEHSYLTSEGTYCVYRADSRDTLREHGVLAGDPIDRITAVTLETN
jgi:hypothetical protein